MTSQIHSGEPKNIKESILFSIEKQSKFIIFLFTFSITKIRNTIMNMLGEILFLADYTIEKLVSMATAKKFSLLLHRVPLLEV